MKILDIPRSGSLQSQTSSHNRYGQYVRSRVTPVNVNSTAQGTVRARMSTNSAGWRSLTDAQRAGWAALGATISRTDSLGQSYTLNGFAAYNLVNNNNLAAGNSIVSAAPALVTPPAIVTATITLTASVFSIAYTATPLGTGEKLFAYVSPQRSAGRAFEGDYRLVKVGAAAAASPLSIFTEYVARLGTPVVGQKIFLSLAVYKGGFLSAPLNLSATVA
jgi:hypothetical protein